MEHLSIIEQDFVTSSAVTSEINFASIFTAQITAENAQKAKFDYSIHLAVKVADASAWYDKKETKALLKDNDIEWKTKETFFKRVFGWQKSYGYKMVRAGKLSNDVVDAFRAHCTRQEEAGEGSNRSIEALLKFAKGETERPSEKPKVEATFTIAKGGFNGEKGYSIRVDEDGTISRNGEILNEDIRAEVAKVFLRIINEVRA